MTNWCGVGLRVVARALRTCLALHAAAIRPRESTAPAPLVTLGRGKETPGAAAAALLSAAAAAESKLAGGGAGAASSSASAAASLSADAAGGSSEGAASGAAPPPFDDSELPALEPHVQHVRCPCCCSWHVLCSEGLTLSRCAVFNCTQAALVNAGYVSLCLGDPVGALSYSHQLVNMATCPKPLRFVSTPASIRFFSAVCGLSAGCLCRLCVAGCWARCTPLRRCANSTARTRLDRTLTAWLLRLRLALTRAWPSCPHRRCRIWTRPHSATTNPPRTSTRYARARVAHACP